MQAGLAGIATASLGPRAGVAPSRLASTLQKLVAHGAASSRSAIASSPAIARRRRQERSLAMVTAVAQGQSDERRIAARRSARKAFARVAPAIFEKVVDDLKARGALVGADRLALPTHKATVAGADDRVRAAIIEAYRAGGLKPPDAAAVESAAKAPTAIVEKVTALLLREKVLVKLDTMVFHAEALQKLKEEVQGAEGERAGRTRHGGRGRVQGSLRGVEEVRDPAARVSRSGARDETNRRRSSRAVARRLLLVGAFLHGALEILDAGADALAELGQPIGAENQDDDRQNDEHFRQAEGPKQAKTLLTP